MIIQIRESSSKSSLIAKYLPAWNTWGSKWNLDTKHSKCFLLQMTRWKYMVTGSLVRLHIKSSWLLKLEIIQMTLTRRRIQSKHWLFILLWSFAIQMQAMQNSFNINQIGLTTIIILVSTFSSGTIVDMVVVKGNPVRRNWERMLKLWQLMSNSVCRWEKR